MKSWKTKTLENKTTWKTPALEMQIGNCKSETGVFYLTANLKVQNANSKMQIEKCKMQIQNSFGNLQLFLGIIYMLKFGSKYLTVNNWKP